MISITFPPPFSVRNLLLIFLVRKALRQPTCTFGCLDTGNSKLANGIQNPDHADQEAMYRSGIAVKCVGLILGAWPIINDILVYQICITRYFENVVRVNTQDLVHIR